MSMANEDEMVVNDLSAERQVLSDRYELLGLLGSGGMGNVYRARDRELDEMVALKVLQPSPGRGATDLVRFRREVRLARRVTHPNVARVFDIGEHEGLRLLTMELVEGESLGARMARERLRLSDALSIARAICSGMQAAHAAGVIHRDLKPDNVLLSHDGRVLVADFGIARAPGEVGLTIGLVGTPTYMAPEQVEGTSDIDHRADIYAFGAMLFEMLVGRPAWEGDSLWAVASARMTKPPPDPLVQRPELLPPLAQLVVRCMARDRGERVGSMAEIDRTLAALDQATAITVAPSKPLSGPGPVLGGATMPGQRRVAVLPFANQGPASHDYVADGLTEDLIDTLSMARDMRVRSRGVVMRYRGQTLDARMVGTELGVQVVVEGSVRAAGDAYRVNVRVVSVADGFQLWAQRFDVPANQLLIYNDRIAQRVAEVLSRELEPPPRRVPEKSGSIDLYLRARHAFQTSFTDHGAEAVRLFRELLAMTPDDPRALAGCAMAESSAMFWSEGKHEDALAMAERAIELEPQLPDGWVARATVLSLNGDPAEALRAARRAYELAPHNAHAHELMGRLLQLAGGRGKAVLHLEAAIALEPTFEHPYIQLFSHYALSGELDAAEEVLARMRANGVAAHLTLAASYCLWYGDVARARQVQSELDPNDRLHSLVLHWLAVLVDGQPPSVGLPPAPPGMTLPRFIGHFFLEIETELCCIANDLAKAEDKLSELDSLGGWNVAWLGDCPVLAELRKRPAVEAIRQRYDERAAEVLAAFR